MLVLALLACVAELPPAPEPEPVVEVAPEPLPTVLPEQVLADVRDRDVLLALEQDNDPAGYGLQAVLGRLHGGGTPPTPRADNAWAHTAVPAYGAHSDALTERIDTIVTSGA